MKMATHLKYERHSMHIFSSSIHVLEST
uniref:Uncharacterized protein n=1 Tax=Arundo donax TaxID=35708 RepID=A0A0A9CFA6_ARUDO